jgi:hypothetical protein
MPAEIIGKCWHCAADLASVDYSREGACLGCGKQTHCCRNCRFYQRGRPNDCFEPMAEPVGDKQRANFCGYFEPTLSPRSPTGASATDGADALRQADDLFK